MTVLENTGYAGSDLDPSPKTPAPGYSPSNSNPGDGKPGDSNYEEVRLSLASHTIPGDQDDILSPYSMSGGGDLQTPSPRLQSTPDIVMNTSHPQGLQDSKVAMAEKDKPGGDVYAVVTKKKPVTSDLDVAENTLYHTYDGHSETDRDSDTEWYRVTQSQT